jgi:protein-S-isoprenylcysteine O-methyltransferase Ste14/NAD-dependent dihydropyrimidine dehydrogenase PreA subunit
VQYVVGYSFKKGKTCLPIDPDFQKKRKKVGKEEGIAVWGPVDPPEKLGVRGTYVAVDWDLCEGCGTCLEVCPVQLYEWMETSDHPTSEKKAFPARETDCVQCYACETQCPAQAIRVTFGGPPGWQGAVALLMLAQIIVGVIYGTLFGPYLGLDILRYVGWIVLVVSLPFFFSPAMYFPRKGSPQEGKSVMDTTVVVDSGTYGIVRHPQILGCTLLMSASILISQHWLSAIIGIPIILWSYIEAPKEEKGLIIKFGNDYKRYMQKVPRMNIIVGIIRLLRRRKR